jgi:hypothetical protein
MNQAMQNEEPVELWHVEVAPNDVRIVTLEQLDEAFQQGLVNERTRVYQEGMDEPAFLGELLGLGDEDDDDDIHDVHEEDTARAAPISTIAPSRHYQETLIGLTANPSTPQRSAPPAQRSAPPPLQAVPRSPAPVARVASAYPPVVQQAPPAYRPPPPPEGAWPPVVQRSAPPAAQVTRSAPPVSAVAPSVVPMAMDLGDDLDFPRPRRRGKGLLLGSGFLVVAAGVALAVTGQGQQLLGSLTARAAPAPAPVKAAPAAQPFKSHALDVGDAPVKLKEAPPPLVLTTRENEAQTVAGTTTTTTTTETAKTPPSKSVPTKSAPAKSVGAHRAKGGGGAAPRSSGGHSGAKPPGMSGGTSKYDPLNGSL